MSSATPIKAALQSLNQHADVVAAALAGVVDIGEEFSRKQVMDLRQAGALRASGEDGYRLHPRLREYLQDHLQLFPAFQSLTDIGAKITVIGSLWTEIVTLSGDRHSAAGMVQEIYSTVLDIEDAMGRNTVQLQILMSTRYGAVASLVAKKAQNNFYKKQTNQLSEDLKRLSVTCKTIEDEAMTRGRDDLARMLRNHLMKNLSGWQHGLSEMQTFMRTGFYKLYQIEQEMKLLARADMLLRQQPGWRGFEVDLPEQIPEFWLAARLEPVLAHFEPMEADRSMVDDMALLVKTLPKPVAVKAQPEPRARQQRIIDPEGKVVIPPELLAIKKLFRAVDALDQRPMEEACTGFSLTQWRESDPHAQTMPTETWLALSVSTLRDAKYPVELIDNPSRPGERFSHTFRDARALPKHTRRQSARINA